MKIIIQQIDDQTVKGHHPQVTIEVDGFPGNSEQVAKTYLRILKILEEESTNE